MTLSEVNFAAIFYIVADSCDDIGAHCVGYQTVDVHWDTEGQIAPNSESLTIDLLADTTYYFIVDGDSSGSVAGDFVITIE